MSEWGKHKYCSNFRNYFAAVLACKVLQLSGLRVQNLKHPLLSSQIISVNMGCLTIKAFEHSLKIKCNELRWKNQLIAC